MTIESIYQRYLDNPNIQTDTRKLQKGDIFFALKGPNFNGNKFVERALEAGASFVVCDEYHGAENENIVLVPDALQALQQLAAYHRNQFHIPFIGITGSNGKTTTKELVHAVLSSGYITYTTSGNLNNHIGVPLTILKIRQDAQMAIIEMGANHMEEIASYCAYARPTHGLITNIGKAHLEGFGGAENVKKAKGELFAYIHAHEGTVFVNAADTNVIDLAEKMEHKLYYGPSGKDVAGSAEESGYFIQVNLTQPRALSIKTQLVGLYNLPNILAAVCIGQYFGLTDDRIKAAIENYTPGNSRSQLLKKGGNEIVLDAYNANPGSMMAAIENFASLKGDKKILLLGDMKELGADSQKEHENIVQLINRHSWAAVALVGENFAKAEHRYHQFNTAEEAAHWFRNNRFEGYQILVKGSRSMTMEKVIE